MANNALAPKNRNMLLQALTDPAFYQQMVNQAQSYVTTGLGRMNRGEALLTGKPIAETLREQMRGDMTTTAMDWVSPGVGMIGATAWHGSPHLFDKFKSEAIGTGEGAQAYGHGLYLAENPAVAQIYKDKLAKPNLIPHVEGVAYPTDFAGGRLVSIADGNRQGIGSMGMKKRSFDDVRAEIQSNLDAEINKKPPQWAFKKGRENDLASFQNDNINNIAAYKKQLLELDSVKGKDITLPDTAHLYKTDIPDAHIDKMLDWDKPLSEQHPDVKKLFKSQLSPYLDISKITGNDLYQMLSKNGGADSASKYLYENGIPGIKYLDGSSRTAGDGTRNFVMFNPDDIRIIERNGQATGTKPWPKGKK